MAKKKTGTATQKKTTTQKKAVTSPGPSGLPPRALYMAIAGIAVLAVLLRWLHVFDADHYYIISPDSHYFHWLADRQMAGDPVALQGSGLAYPLAYLARVLDVLGWSRPEALDLASKLLPPIIALAGMAVLYLGVKRMYHPSLAVFSTLAWAIAPTAILIGAAGYLDRDSLSIVLIATGALIFYVSKDWRLKLSGTEFGWLLAAALVTLIEGILYVEWKWAGPAFLLAILVPYSLIELAFIYVVPNLKKTQRSQRQSTDSPGSSHWKTLTVVLACNALAVAVMHEKFLSYAHYIADAFGNAGESSIQEMIGLAPADILQYRVLLISIAFGVGIATVRRSKADIFFLTWLGCLFLVGLFASRAFLMATPALCVFAAIGIDTAFQWAARRKYRVLRTAAFALLIVAFLVDPVLHAQRLAQPRMAAADTDWQGAMTYLRERTLTPSTVVSWWDYGYWILDMGRRTPFVDNGYYGYDTPRLDAVADVYCETDPAWASVVLRYIGVDYVIFSRDEIAIAPTILKHTELPVTGGFPQRSLYARVMTGDFESEGGLEIVWRSSPESPHVVILRVT